VTLLEILETSAEAFWRLSSILGQLIIRLENHQIDESNMGAAASSLGELMRKAERLNLRMAVQQLERIKEQLFGERRDTLASVRPMLLDLHMRILDMLEDRVFLIVPPECKELYVGDQNRRLFLRSAKPVAARVEREHQWPAETVLSEGHRLVGALASLSEQSSSSAQRTTP
jgi:hypothetical protein